MKPQTTTRTGPPVNVLTYQPPGERDDWQVQLWPELAAEFDLSEDQMHTFHEHASRRPRAWLMVRRVFGVSPLIPPLGAKVEDLMPHPRSTVAEQLGVTVENIKEELLSLRAHWRTLTSPMAELSAPGSAGVPPAGVGLGGSQSRRDAGAPGEPEPDDLFVDEKLLEAFDFSEDMFKFEWKERTGKNEVTTVPGRSNEAQKRERAWFLRRLAEMRKMFAEPRSAPLARQAIMNELWLRRYEMQLHSVNPVSDDGVALAKRIVETQKTLQNQLQELDEMFPQFGLTSKVKFRAVISDVMKGVAEYLGRDDNRLVNYMGTAAELVVLMRQSQQAPVPQIRGDLSLAAHEAAAGLFDPNFRAQLKPSELRKFREGMTAGIVKVREEAGEPLLDLESEDGWFEDPVAKPEEGSKQ